MPVEVGQPLPAVEVQEGDPANKVSMEQLFKGKKGVLFAVPGAFTPGCSKTHLPGFVELSDQLRSKGIEEVACISVNDAFVMAAWGREHGAEGKVCSQTHTLTLLTPYMLTVAYCQILIGPNDNRVSLILYAMVVEDGVVKKLNVEPDGTGLTCSLASNILADLV
ncbi:peroxiredoxin-5, mitochondrial [Arapaima gigas]